MAAANVCEFCGEAATKKSHLSPMGFVNLRRSRGFTEFDTFWYCQEHYLESVEGFWSRVKTLIS